MQQWLKNAQVAELLSVSVRTIKRWMTYTTARSALGVVRHGKQWRIPRPDDEWTWKMHTRHRLKGVGACLRPDWEGELRKIGRQCDRYLVESYRLWLAAYIKALERGRVTQKTRENLLLLWQTACKVLNPPKPLKRYEMDVDQLKGHFPHRLCERGLSVKSIMHYWPQKRHFDHVHAAHTRADLEGIRRELDFWQAYRDELRRGRGKQPSVRSLCHLLHKDLMTHINDTRERLPGIVVKNPKPQVLRAITMASVHSQVLGKPSPLVVVDFRRPQNGISLRTFRTRYPREPQQPIIAKVRRILSAAHCIDEKPYTGKTPVRDSTCSTTKRNA